MKDYDETEAVCPETYFVKSRGTFWIGYCPIDIFCSTKCICLLCGTDTLTHLCVHKVSISRAMKVYTAEKNRWSFDPAVP